MPLTFNTSHPLAGNVTAMIAVEDGVFTEIKNRTLSISVHASASYGTGTYGAHLRTSGSGYTRYGATFTGGIAVPTALSGASVVIVVNAVHLIAGGNGTILDMAGAGSPPNIFIDSVRPAQGDGFPFGTGTLNAGSGASMLTVTRAAGDVSSMIAYLNASESVATTGGYSSMSGGIAGIGGNAATASIDLDVVYLVVFDVVLTPTQVSDLYASLGAGNTFALLGGAAPTPSLHPRRVFPASILNF